MKDATGGRHHFGVGLLASRQIDWWTVHEFVEELDLPDLPFPGTVAWCELEHQDKKLACIAAAPHYALLLNTRQEHLADASKQIAAATDWAAVARNITRRSSGIYVPRERRSA